MNKTIDIAIVGATGAVGEIMLSILAQGDLPIGNVYALASERSAGKQIRYGDRDLRVEVLEHFDFSKAQIGLFSAGASVSKEQAPRAVEAGCIVIDNTSMFRYDADIPLVVPEINPDQIKKHVNRGIIANPNCSTIQMVLALKPIYDAVGIKRINVCTYQAVSGSGRQAIEELASQTRALLNGKKPEHHVYPVQIAFNVLPHIDSFQENGYTREEMKMVWETRKILEDDTIQVNPTAVRVPVFHGHSEAIHIETCDKITAIQAREILSNAAGVTVLDKHKDGGYPTPVGNSVNQDPVYIGRIREDISHPCGLNMWVVSDNLRKGAALNSIQIADFLVKRYL